MSRIDELIEKMCPNGVELKPIQSVCEIFSGFPFKSELFNSDKVGIPLIRIRDVNSGFSGTYYSGDYDARYIVENGDILIGMDGDFKAVIWKHGPSLLNQRVCRLQSFEPEILPSFIFYKVQDELDRIQSGTQGSTVKHLSSKELGMARIPVPPLEVQQEIVKVLNTFTQLEAELEAELEARRRQYQYYRDALLTFGEHEFGIEWTTLGEVCKTVSSGGTPSSTRSDYYGGSIPWLRTQEVDWGVISDTELKITEEGLRNSSAKWIPANCVIVAMYGATAAKVAINAIPLTTNQACCNLEIDSAQAITRYVFHWISNEYQRLREMGEGSQSNLNAQKVKGYPIAIPSLKRQVEIVEVLDKFDALVNDISTGLPAEIKARRQQYEHYRDRLLTFKEAA